MTDHVVRPIESGYAGCRFRSRLEARWAVFFDTMGIPWQYEPQGFTLSDGRKYLPDFLLPECGTWVEVKGGADRLDRSLIEQAARDLPAIAPQPGCESGPRLMLLGPIPRPQPGGDYGWPSLDADGMIGCYGFSTYYKNRRPWWLPCSYYPGDHPGPLVPCFVDDHDGAQEAYGVARAARFEYGDTGADIRHDDESVARAVARGVEVALRELHRTR